MKKLLMLLAVMLVSLVSVQAQTIEMYDYSEPNITINIVDVIIGNYQSGSLNIHIINNTGKEIQALKFSITVYNVFGERQGYKIFIAEAKDGTIDKYNLFTYKFYDIYDSDKAFFRATNNSVFSCNVFKTVYSK